MFKKKYDLAIVNRSFWPDYPIIGEGLVQLAESYKDEAKVLVLSQGEKPLKNILKKYSRGTEVECETFLKPVDSSISLLKRIAQSIGFMFWVFWKLFRKRPKKVYVSTDPPVIVPFITCVYCKLFKAEFVYHLQDIHPEITSIHLKRTKILSSVLKVIDNFSIRNSNSVIVLSEQMRQSITKRVGHEFTIHIVQNPAVTDVSSSIPTKRNSIIFCGNAGRLQRIPLVVDTIRNYFLNGGLLSFEFIGGGVYKEQLEALASEFANVKYYGVLPSHEAAKITRECQWGLMPIDDEVTEYAFPSKSSTYAVAGVSIIAVCGANTSVGEWVRNNNLGIVVRPSVEELLKCFKDIESGDIEHIIEPEALSMLRQDLSFESFVTRLRSVIKVGE